MSPNRARALLALPVLLLSGAALAAEPSGFPAAPPPPPMPKQAPAQQAAPIPSPEPGVEPDVTIIRRGPNKVEEYRVHGRLYMVKIIPARGYPYYLIDTNGDGHLDTYKTGLENPNIVQWRLFQW